MIRLEKTSSGFGFSLNCVTFLPSSKPTIPNLVGSSTSHNARVPLTSIFACCSNICPTFRDDTMSPLKQANLPEITSLQLPRAPPVPRGLSSGTILTSKSTSALLKYSFIWSTLYPPATTTSSTKSAGTPSTTLSRRVASSIGSRGFGTSLVHGRKREPTPPARTTTCMTKPITTWLLNASCNIASEIASFKGRLLVG